ncbi:glycosyltransferase [Vibrio diazotrophicus]|uniref:glycosyltransferase n=1 Tax=Vibrio diazotrophicus TaxID=685 RepID=UPI000C9DB9DA|nr:glycosyltransferase [Vibrio diazotrophicus]PNH90096.1 glycosyltransferase [Vibrio diazotrophicus]
MTSKIEVIMAAYNNVRDMRLVFEGYLRQENKDFTICITDDGSGPEVKALVDVYASLGLSIRYLWQEDEGYRRALALNRAIESSTAQYIVMTDNDCIPSRYFIEDYHQLLAENTMLFGRRVDLYEPASNLIRNHTISLDAMESPTWLLIQAMKKGLKRPEMGIRFPSFIFNLLNRKKRGAIGANLAVPRVALLAVNGFDADYEGYGMEETDLVWRLEQAGVIAKTVLSRCALFHLYHKEKAQSCKAMEMFKHKRECGRIECINGINRLSSNTSPLSKQGISGV